MNNDFSIEMDWMQTTDAHVFTIFTNSSEKNNNKKHQ